MSHSNYVITVLISCNMEFGRVIPEAEEALEHSLMMPPALDHKPPATTLK